jgi:hypothetical protein
VVSLIFFLLKSLNRNLLKGEGGTKKLYKNSFHAMSSIVKNEGFIGLYAGLLKAIKF